MSEKYPQLDEFQVLLRRSNLVVPAERLPVLFSCFRQVQHWGELIRARRCLPSEEPANTYRVDSITRAGDLE